MQTVSSLFARVDVVMAAAYRGNSSHSTKDDMANGYIHGDVVFVPLISEVFHECPWSEARSKRKVQFALRKHYALLSTLCAAVAWTKFVLQTKLALDTTWKDTHMYAVVLRFSKNCR
jgi:hypothetical protein